MIEYNPPLAQLLLAMRVAGNLSAEGDSRLSLEDAQAVLSEAGRFAADRIAPLNRIGDQKPAKLSNGLVTTPPGWSELYRDWCAAGWNSLSGPLAYGGQSLGMQMATACTELWNSSSMAFALCPLLTTGAIETIAAHAADDLKQFYLPRMIAGEWSGTMNLTEPQSGSDLSQLRCKAKRSGDGSYIIAGSKIFITYGEHDFTSNIIHLVLARLENAPQGTKGISLFLVPKYLPGGSPNDVECHSLEHKLGIHGSPTCSMSYGNKNGGAKGWLIGEENRGLACMFTMMNNARLLVGVQGVALAERATQAAFQFAKMRKQGRLSHSAFEPSEIIHHPDIKRMLLEMRAKTAAARLLCMATASAIDERQEATASLLTPLAKSFATDIANEVASAAIQVHGGMGYIEETGIAQIYRDARILPIYEGTNGIQAIDLVTRKLTLDDGKCLSELLHGCKNDLASVVSPALAADYVDEVRRQSEALTTSSNTQQALAAATPFTRALASLVAAAYLAKASRLARGSSSEEEAETNARLFAMGELPIALSGANAAITNAALVFNSSLA
ncbi:MAG: acyl-CoA dehydrogenase family protein [Alphaproteobacteria bacterium]|nr:acyl-CoA dehydrogenase family protein [Alphaproteobacteria bacterium]